MSNHNDRIEAMTEILSDAGIEASADQIKDISEAFALHLEMEREIGFNQHFRRSEEACSKCSSLTRKLKEANEIIEVYRSSVMARRNASEVWIENDEVKYKH